MPIIWNDLQGVLGGDLTATIIGLEIPGAQWPVDRLIDWDERGIETLTAIIDYNGGVLELIPNTPRGGVSHPFNPGSNKSIEITAAHLVQRDAIYADAGLARQAGSTTTTPAETLRDDHLRAMKRNLAASNAALRLGALKGLVLDASGETIADLFALFGLAQQTHDFDFANAASNIVNQAVAAQRKSLASLDGVPPPEDWVALCSPSFMDAMRASPSFEKLSVHARPREALTGGGIIVDQTEFVEVYAPPALGSHLGIADGEALLCPRGVASLYLSRYAPADSVDAVGDVGLPYYARSEEMSLGKGFTLEAQSNPVHVVTRPRSIVRLTAD